MASKTGGVKRTLGTSSPFSKLARETNQSPELRRPLIEDLERHFDARVVLFFTSFSDFKTQITDDDAEMLESILAAEHDGKKLVLVVNSPGGQALAAERMANLCRQYSAEDGFEVVVPHMAKSAATMICFGADKIHMSRTAELGPVDPQVTYKDDFGIERWISAEEYVRAYDDLMDKGTKSGAKNIEPFLQQLNRFDARYIEALKSAQKLSEDISVSLLRSGMMKGKTEAAVKKAIAVFLKQQATQSHGRMISHDGAKACGLNVDLIDLYSPLWNTIWELYVRADWAVTRVHRKLIESSTSSVHN